MFLLLLQFDPMIAHDYRISDGNYSLKWIDNLKQLHANQTCFIANELFDAYPIHKFQVSHDRSMHTSESDPIRCVMTFAY
jgi:hypothetical protein